MIPLRLTLKNFLSYGPQEQTINFEPYHLICLSGKNGHGKSALLDAITWAVWGMARKISGTAKADADIVRLGQTFMMVSFDFSFNGHIYRIKREYGKTFAKPYSSCEFGVFDTTTQKMKSLTDKTIRTTQEKIQKTIGLDYESFINTAFLRQGHANEFSKKSPQERKDILASILNLHIYEELRKTAQERVRHAESKKLHLMTEQSKLKEELGMLSNVLEKLENVNASHDIILKKDYDNKLHQKTIIGHLKKIDEQLKAFQLARFRYTQLIEDESKKQNELLSLITRWRSINRQLNILSNYIFIEHEKKELQQQLKKQQENMQLYLEQKELFLQAKEKEQSYIAKSKELHTINVQNQILVIERLRAQITTSRTELDHYHTIIKKTEYEIKNIENRQLGLEKQQVEGNNKNSIKLEEKFEKRKAYYHTLVSRLQQIYLEQKQLVQKQQFTQESESPSCPLCEQNLSVSRKSFLKTKFTESAHFYRHRRNRLESTTKRLKELLIQQHAELQQIQLQHKEQQIQKTQLQELKKNSAKLKEQLEEYAKKQNQITHIITEIEQKNIVESEKLQKLHMDGEQLLSKDKQYKALEDQKKEIEENLKKNSYIGAYVQETTKKLEDTEKKLQEYQVVMHEKSFQTQRLDTIIGYIHVLKSKKKEKKKLMQELSLYADIETEQLHLHKQQEQIIEELKNTQTTKEQLLQEKGRLEQQKIYLELQQQKYKDQEKQLHQLAQNMFEYSAIATALSKNGIQALLIEDAIPEIEHEANILLGQLTDNQTHIMIESVRDLKKGGSRETLDINISDPMGIRPYELFSGGEAFRIDFALRIAISKLLARRAGTSLQTLIIDEGFGSQDEEGLSRLMDAIYKIQDNFNKVIIVSHLPALKEQFPVHFVISKGTQGSTVQVVEQG